MDRKRKDDDTLAGSLQSLRGEHEEIGKKIVDPVKHDIPKRACWLWVHIIAQRGLACPSYPSCSWPGSFGTSSLLLTLY